MASQPNILTSSSSVNLSKVAIPRLINKRNSPPRSTVNSRTLNRVNRACLGCRSRKIKCDAAKPTCENCSRNNTSCTYISSRKDRLKIATGHNRAMIALLRDLRGQVESSRRTRIDDMLASVLDDVADAADRLDMSSEAQEAEERRTSREASGSATTSQKAMSMDERDQARTNEDSRSSSD